MASELVARLQAEHGTEILAYTGAGFAGMLLCYGLAPTTSKDRLSMANSMFWFMAAPALIYYSISATLALRASVESRWTAGGHHSVEFQRAYVALQIVASCVELIKSGSFQSKIPMLAHHVLSCFCYLGALLTGRMHFFAVLDGCCETTTIFVSFLQMALMEGGGVHEWTKSDPVGKKAHLVNGGLLWLSFVVFRLVLFTVWLVAFVLDLLVLPPHIWDKMTTVELTVNPAVTVFLLILSAGWFKKIHAGLVKALSGKVDKSQ